MNENDAAADCFSGEGQSFSLTEGGWFFGILCRLRLARLSPDLIRRRIAVLLLITWLPLAVLAALSKQAVNVPFWFDLDAQSRLVLCMPLLIAAEGIVHRRFKLIIDQFMDRKIIADQDQPRFKQIIVSAVRLRNSMTPELLLLAVAVSGIFWLERRYIEIPKPTWYAIPADDGTRLTAAGCWYLFVSLTLLRFLLFRWYFRIFIWYRFCWQIALRIRLGLNTLHPDRAGGIGFLSGSLLAFFPVLLAHTIALAGTFGGKIWHEGAKLTQFEMEIVVWTAFLAGLVLTPLFFFAPQLAQAKRIGLEEFGTVASRYVAGFRRKWIEGHAQANESLVGSADIQSLADLANSFEIVEDMRLVPFRKAMVLRLVLLILVPLLLLVPTMIPLEDLINRALASFF